MNEIEEIKIKLEAYKSGVGEVNDVIDQIQTIAFNAAIPALDLLQARLDDGSYIAKQSGVWCLFDDTGAHVTSGESVREMIVNLIFTDA